MIRLGTFRLGAGRFGGELATQAEGGSGGGTGHKRRIFDVIRVPWEAPAPVRLRAEMRLDLVLTGRVEVTGDEEDVLLLLAGAA